MNDKWGRNFLGTPPQGRADYAFIGHILKSLNSNSGRCAILLPHGVLFRNEEHNIRKSLIESDLIEAVIGLGPNLFYNSPMEASIIICRTRKDIGLNNKIIFINALKEVERKNGESYLLDTHINKIVGAYKNILDHLLIIYKQADKSKVELKQCIENIDKVIKSLINNI